MLSIFSVNDDENEVNAKLAIKECLAELRSVELDITQTVSGNIAVPRSLSLSLFRLLGHSAVGCLLTILKIKALVELRRGELRGLDFRFKTATSLFRKLMSRLDTLVAASVRRQSPVVAVTP